MYRIAWRLALAVAFLLLTLGVLEGLGVRGLRLVASHETFLKWADTFLLFTIAFLLVEALHSRRRDTLTADERQARR